MSLKKLALKLYRTSPESVVKKLRDGVWKRNKDCKPVSPDFLRSVEYQELMLHHLPYNKKYDQHEAQNRTRNFCFRHFEVNERLGVFRWRGIQKNLDTVLKLITKPEILVVDFGGAAGPLGLNSKIVDHLKKDYYGNVIEYHSLSELPAPADVIFSSHCLEHIPNLEGTLQELFKALKSDGHLILHLPSFSCDRWRVGKHKHKIFNDHVWTFGLTGTDNLPPNLVNYTCIDTLVKKISTLKIAEYCGDDSIFILAQKQDAS